MAFYKCEIVFPVFPIKKTVKWFNWEIKLFGKKFDFAKKNMLKFIFRSKTGIIDSGIIVG